MNKVVLYSAALLAALTSCAKEGDDTGSTSIDASALTVTNSVVIDSFIGNGPQWGGYDIVEQWTGSNTLSDEDWATTFERLDFMRPQFVRIMISAGWSYYENNEFKPEKCDPIMTPILDYCQENNITVQFGEWGHTEVDGDIDEQWIEDSANFISYLVNDKGYSCIKYFTMTNEPNGDWSTVNGDTTLWKNLVTKFYNECEELGLTSKVEIMGPDIAVWTSDNISWFTNIKSSLSTQIGAYDIHTYPDEDDVRTTSYTSLLDVYKAASDQSKPIVMGELGLKYDTTGDLGIENAARIAADRYASSDSQMFVYDSFYGIDVADATIQTMTAGYAGVIYWMLDDAMYNGDGSSSTELKRWGFWNILGEEKFESAEDENIRPWFYPISLMCRFFPAGSQIYDVQLPTPVKSGLRCVAAEHNGKHTIAIVNNGDAEHSFNLKSTDFGELDNMVEYRYISGEGAEFEGSVDQDGFPVAAKAARTIDTKSGEAITIEAKSFILLTNMD